jgi:putative transposase
VVQPLPATLPPVVRHPAPAERQDQSRIAALDPGVRTFQTIFDVHGGVALEWGKSDMGRIARLLQHLDHLQSRRDQPETRARRRYRINKAMERVRQKVRHLVDDVHSRLAKFLCTSYDVILLPTFETSKMSRKIPQWPQVFEV